MFTSSLLGLSVTMALLTTAQTQEPMLGFTAIESSKAEADKPKDISKKPEAKKPEAKKPSAELEKAQAQVKQLQEQMKKLHEQMRATAAKLQVAHRELLKFGGHPGAKEGHHPGAWLGFLFHGMKAPTAGITTAVLGGITVSAAGQEDGTTTEASQGITVSAAGQEDGTTIEASQGITVLAADSGTCRTTLSGDIPVLGIGQVNGRTMLPGDIPVLEILPTERGGTTKEPAPWTWNAKWIGLIGKSKSCRGNSMRRNRSCPAESTWARTT